MEVLPNEIKEVKTVGRLFNGDVKMVVTDGGFHLFVGKKTKKAQKSEVLAGSSHVAIGLHQVAKDFGSDFQPSLAKSEQEQLPNVEDKSNHLPRHSIEKGIELFTVSKGSKVEFILYKRGITLGKYEAEAKEDSLVLKKHYFNDMIKAERETAEAISRAIKDKAYDLKLSTIEEDWL